MDVNGKSRGDGCKAVGQHAIQNGLKPEVDPQKKILAESAEYDSRENESVEHCRAWIAMEGLLIDNGEDAAEDHHDDAHTCQSVLRIIGKIDGVDVAIVFVRDVGVFGVNGGHVKTGAELVRRQLKYAPKAPDRRYTGGVLNNGVEGDNTPHHTDSPQTDRTHNASRDRRH